MSKRKTQLEFLEDAHIVHGDNYDYTKSMYVSDKTPLIIICKKHGEFSQPPTRHLQGAGCPICGGKVKISTSEFIEQCKSIHGDKFDYSKVVYNGSGKKIEVICKHHGIFFVTASHHLTRKTGCQLCAAELRTSCTSDFIIKSKKIHGDVYDYSKSNYKKNNLKVVIVCPIHGDFLQTPQDHLMGKGCKVCGLKKASESRKKSHEEFIKDCIARHGDRYDYSHTVYGGNTRMPVKIICRIHGAFFQRATNHLRGDGCRKCSDKECSDRQSYDLSKFVEMANAKHGKFYDYSKSIYTSSQDKLEIICPLHGSFHQVPAAHLSGMGCPKCANEKASVRLTKTKDEFVSLAKSVHGERYDYKNSNYCGVFDKIEIGCKIHGPFFQTPDSHTNGGAGCPKCNLSKGELKIMRFGERYGLSVIHQKSFDDCRNPKTNRKLKFDFYAPLQNILIEYDGEQHFHQCTFGNHVLTDEEFKDIQFKDRVKTKYAHDNGIKLLRIPFEKLDNINEILTHEFLSPIPK